MPPQVRITFHGPGVLIHLLRSAQQATRDVAVGREIGLGAERLLALMRRQPGAVPTTRREVEKLVLFHFAEPRIHARLQEHRADLLEVLAVGYRDWTRSFPREIHQPLGNLRERIVFTLDWLWTLEGTFFARTALARLVKNESQEHFWVLMWRRLLPIQGREALILGRRLPALDEAAGRSADEAARRIDDITTELAQMERELRQIPDPGPTEEFIPRVLGLRPEQVLQAARRR